MIERSQFLVFQTKTKQNKVFFRGAKKKRNVRSQKKQNVDIPSPYVRTTSTAATCPANSALLVKKAGNRKNFFKNKVNIFYRNLEIYFSHRFLRKFVRITVELWQIFFVKYFYL